MNVVGDVSSVSRGKSSTFVRRWRGVMFAALIPGLALIAGATSVLALPVCTTSISACCKITSANAYGLTGPVTAVAGGDCIQITKPV